jgi:hypothetical protein
MSVSTVSRGWLSVSPFFGIVTEEDGKNVSVVFLHSRGLPPRFCLGYINAREDGGFATCGLVLEKGLGGTKEARGNNNDLHVFGRIGGRGEDTSH